MCSENIILLGWDAAVQEENNGLVIAKVSKSKIQIIDKWHRDQSLLDYLKNFLGMNKPFENQYLFCIDSPLGWPEQLGTGLSRHKAGDFLGSDLNGFFRRETDLDIYRRFQKMPLEVGADRIARTAFKTLERVQALRTGCSIGISLVWSPQFYETIGMIETYPAALLMSRGLNSKSYKQKDRIHKRVSLLASLENYFDWENLQRIDLLQLDHDFDAFLCVLQGYEFLQGNCLAPKQKNASIEKDGWIWASKNRF